MPLYEFQNYNKYGNVRTRLVSSPKGKSFEVNPKGLGGYIGVRMFKYEHKHPIYPPSLIVIDNQKYITPEWQPVLMETELSDIKWIKPEVKRAEIIEHRFKSSSSDKVYIAKEYIAIDGSRKYNCNCFGSIRAKDGCCTHIKNIKNK